MNKLIDAALKSFRSLTDPGMVGVFIKSIIITVIFLISLAASVSYGATLAADQWSDLRYAGYIPWVASFGGIVLAWILFPGILPLIVSFFDEAIIRNIEDHEYPHAAPAIKIPFLQEFFHDLKFALKAILLNILVLPLYFVPMLNIFVFFSLNGYLLGSEFYFTVARRHLPYTEAKRAKRNNSFLIFIGGVLLVFLSTIPIINLFAPFWGIALMTHLYHAK